VRPVSQIHESVVNARTVGQEPVLGAEGWLWADASDLDTVDIAGLPPGEHKVKIELVDANHQVFPGQSKTVTFTVPDHQGAKVHSKAPQ
jgi:Family of unknown function (DUF6130)